MKYIAALLLLLLLQTQQFQLESSQEDHNQTLFKIFKEDFKKMYTQDQENQKFNTFKNNIAKIFSNQQDDKSAKYSTNEFADLSSEEFETQFLTLPTQNIDEEEIPQQAEAEFGLWDLFNPKPKVDLPKSFDWRDKGKVTSVKAQSSCGSCWAFTTAAILESQYAIKYGESIELSEQQLLDCDTINDGCGGGLMTDAYKYLSKKNVGLETREDYGDYLNSVGQCHYDSKLGKAKIINYYQIAKDEEAIQEELFLNGPIAVGVNGRYLQFYDGGVLDNDKCDDKINHAVVVVGWGEEEDGTKYWNIKNQWGKHWGEEGYFKLVRGKKRCGIHTYASIAYVE